VKEDEIETQWNTSGGKIVVTLLCESFLFSHADEIHHCHHSHNCNSYTRFPRYNNAVKQIVESRGRGRSGEYSILLYRILRSLGHEAGWVVDWADHVWAECRIGGRGSIWILVKRHLIIPCSMKNGVKSGLTYCFLDSIGTSRKGSYWYVQ